MMKQELKQIMPLLQPEYPTDYNDIFMKIKNRIEAKQYSHETNELIEKLIPFGETNYTCWVTKKRILEAGQTTIEHEDSYSQQVLKDNLKNFQIWDYRNYIVGVTKDYEREYTLMDEILKESPKNYHLWSNRIKVVEAAKNYGEQIKRTEICILKDYYNNSAWAYRSHCFRSLEQKDYSQQISFVLEKIRMYIDNEAAWNYLRGFFPTYSLKNLKTRPALLSYSNFPEVKELCEQISKNLEHSEQSKIQALLTLLIINSQSKQTIQYAKQICSYLNEIDNLRSNYYQWLIHNLS